MNKIKLYIADIDGGGKHLLVKSKINGHKGFLLIDTGASNSIFDINFHAFDINTLESINESVTSSGFNSTIDEIYHGETIFLNISHFKTEMDNVIFTSLDHVNSLYSNLKLPVIAGILGSDFLLKYKAIIDFSQKILVLEK